MLIIKIGLGYKCYQMLKNLMRIKQKKVKLMSKF